MVSDSTTTISTFDDDWLSDRIGQQVRIRNIEAIFTGYTSQVYRLTIHTVSHQSNLPDSVILKVPSDSASAMDLANRFHARKKESRFYIDLASRLQVDSPELLFHEQAPFVLALRDHGPSLEQASPSVSEQQLHALLTTLATVNSSFTAEQEAFESWQTAVTAAEPDMENLYLPGLKLLPDTPAKNLLTRYGTHSLDHLPLYKKLPQVFSHMDFRPANICFNSARPVILDWAEYSFAPVGFDLAWFMMTSFSTEKRRALEAGAIDFYQEKVSQRGLNHITRLDIETGYRLSLLPAYYLPALMLNRDAGQSQAGNLAERIHSAVTDHLTELVELI